jgi:hypothetical protein
MTLSLDQVVTCSVDLSSAIVYISEQDVALSPAYHGAARVSDKAQPTRKHFGGLAQEADYSSPG